MVEFWTSRGLSSGLCKFFLTWSLKPRGGVELATHYAPSAPSHAPWHRAVSPEGRNDFSNFHQATVTANGSFVLKELLWLGKRPCRPL